MDFDALPVHDLSPASQGIERLLPETLVDVINRGRDVLVRKFDGRDYPLRPYTEGLMRIPYAAALHFQKHSTVPGTRDAGSGAEQSFIGIVRVSGTNQPVDPPEFCEPFDQDACEVFEHRIEAIARDADEPIQVVSVAAMTASGRVPVGRQSSGRRKLERAGKGDVASAMAPPDEPNEAQLEIAAAAAESDED